MCRSRRRGRRVWDSSCLLLAVACGHPPRLWRPLYGGHGRESKSAGGERARQLPRAGPAPGSPTHHAWQSHGRRSRVTPRHRINELVASVQAYPHCLPWPWGRPRAVAEGGAVRKIRGMPRQRVGGNAPEHRLLCSCTREMSAPHTPACAPHVSKGYVNQQNVQPVNGQSPANCLVSAYTRSTRSNRQAYKISMTTACEVE